MDKEYYIRKWLDGTLTDEERKTFEQSSEYKSLEQLLNATRAFKAPEYNTGEELKRLQDKKSEKGKTVSLNFVKPLLKIAAVVALVLTASIYFTYDSSTSVQTVAAEKKEVYLPDSSFVILNANSKLTYDENSWDINRKVSLEGEAFFKVAKGSDFDVNTISGQVSVLGTAFNVKNRGSYFEVICFEGLVNVQSQNEKLNLKPDHMFRLMNGKIVTKPVNTNDTPEWTRGRSKFDSVPLRQVIDEMERQYGVTIKAKNIDLNQHFTGGFVHNDIDLALKSISNPLNIQYKVKDHNYIILSVDNN